MHDGNTFAVELITDGKVVTVRLIGRYWAFTRRITKWEWFARVDMPGTKGTEKDATEAEQTTDNNELRIVKMPESEKGRAIAEASLDYPDATNAEIADVVEQKIGDRPDESWVSRVRNNNLGTDAADDAREDADVGLDSPPEGSVVAKVADLEDRLDDAAEADDVDRLIDAVDSLAAAIDAMATEVEELNDRVEEIEFILGEEVTDQLVARLLRKRADDIDTTVGKP